MSLYAAFSSGIGTARIGILYGMSGQNNSFPEIRIGLLLRQPANLCFSVDRRRIEAGSFSGKQSGLYGLSGENTAYIRFR